MEFSPTPFAMFLRGSGIQALFVIFTHGRRTGSHSFMFSLSHGMSVGCKCISRDEDGHGEKPGAYVLAGSGLKGNV